MTGTKEKLVVIGNGMVSQRLLEKLSEQKCSYDITVFGDEPHAGYNRILLSPMLSGEKKLDDVITHSKEWYQENSINLQTGKMIISIDRDQKTVIDKEDKKYPYDKLVIATGSNPFVPPISGSNLQGVYTYRTIDDVEAMLKFSQAGKKAVVIGGGLLGLEVAYGLKKQGMDVSVLHLADILMERQMDSIASDKLIASLSEKGIDIHTRANTVAINGTDTVESVLLEDGTIFEADLVVIAVGIQPNIKLAQSASLECERGIVVNNHLLTSDEDIFAIGECAQHEGMTYGLVAPLYEQASVCADYICGDENATYKGSIMSTNLKVTGIDLFSAGQFNEEHDCKTITLSDDTHGIYRKLITKNNILIGALLFGDINASSWYRDLIQSRKDISSLSDILMFGPEFISDQMQNNGSPVNF